jgi:hypothetical protein
MPPAALPPLSVPSKPPVILPVLGLLLSRIVSEAWLLLLPSSLMT